MKVLVATHSYSGNGAAVMLLAVLEYWVRSLGWTVDVLVGKQSEVPAELVRTGATAQVGVEPKNYDFALVNTIVSSQYLEMLSSHVATALWVHEGETVIHSASYTGAQWRRVFDLAHKTIFQSRWQSDVVFRSFLTEPAYERVACVRNGLPHLPSDLSQRPRTPGKRRIVFVGGVYGRKRPQDLVDAVLRLGRSDLECCFLGNTASLDTLGSEAVAKFKARPELFKLVGELDRASALAYVASADLFCLPSEDESQPIAPVEAAALGVPCLLSDLPPYRGTWTHGVDCLMHPIGHAPLLAHNVTIALSDSGIRASMISAAKHVVARFGLDRFLRQFTSEMPI